MKKLFKTLVAVVSLLISQPVLCEPALTDSIGSHLDQFLNSFTSRPTATPTKSKSKLPDLEDQDPRVRSHQEGILDISGVTITPARIAVKAGPASVVGSLELTIRNETNSRWFFRAENLSPETNVWDDKGRAVLVPGKVTCQVLHRASLNESEQAGLSLSVDASAFDVVSFSYSSGVSTERARSTFFEDEDICPIGEVPAFTTQKEIEKKCKKCLGGVLKTLKQDAQARLSSLSFTIDAPICSDDSDCYREDTDWHRGRCVLVKDKNGSHFSECRARSSIGGACPGKGSRRMFEYPCDKGLACVKTHSASSFFDYNSYECRDPKNWKFKGPLKASRN